ncbi:MAG TPA: tyrosine-type recombinase/integrase, partial [Acetobacteraceae bacterium]|nr:tyrosine-type recombinase/integrase [Acetobacteraceae bacterium]
QQKTGEDLVVPCHRDLRAELDAWRGDDVASLDSRPVLTNESGHPWEPTALSHAIANALQRAGMPGGLNVHGLRKLAAVRLAEAGCSTKEIGAITGHQTLAMIDLYTRKTDQRRLAEAAIGRLENAGNRGNKVRRLK